MKEAIKKMPTWLKVTIVVIVIGGIGSALSDGKNEEVPKTFSQMSAAEKNKWIKHELQNSSALNTVLVDRIKSQFKYPLEVGVREGRRPYCIQFKN